MGGGLVDPPGYEVLKKPGLGRVKLTKELEKDLDATSVVGNALMNLSIETYDSLPSDRLIEKTCCLWFFTIHHRPLLMSISKIIFNM